MRCLLLLALLAAAVAHVAAQGAPPSPIPAGRNDGNHGMCLLDSMSLSGGLSLQGSYAQDRFEYTCSGDWSAVGFGASGPKLTLNLVDIGSTAQIWLNGKAVNTKAQGNGLTGDGDLTSAPLATSAADWRTGENLIQVNVNCHADPVTGEHLCNYLWEIKCNKPAAPAPSTPSTPGTPSTPPPSSGGFVTGDPQFVGLRGQNFQVHGVSGEIYNIVSDADLQYNSRFVFLESGKCPVVDGRKQKACWSHPGSYLGELGLKTRAGDRIKLISGAHDLGFATVEVNGKSLEVGDSVMLADSLGSVTRNSTHLASVTVGNWDFAFENSDMFVNQRVRVFDSRGLRSHGLLGQTWRDVKYNNAVKHIQGEVDDYVIRDADLFGDNFVYNAFN